MEISKHWRLQRQRYRLIGEICPRCSAKIFPPKAACPYCNYNPDLKIREKIIVSPPNETCKF